MLKRMVIDGYDDIHLSIAPAYTLYVLYENNIGDVWVWDLDVANDN